MRAAVTLAVLTMVLAVGCLDDRAPEPEPITVTVTQEAPASIAEPTPTWQQWLGQQVLRGKCGNPNNILIYQNVRKEPPYSADFFCQRTDSAAPASVAAPGPVPSADAIQESTSESSWVQRPAPRPTATRPWWSTPTPHRAAARWPTERPTPRPTLTRHPTATTRPTVARYPTATPAPEGLPVLHSYENGELFVAAYVTWNDNSYVGGGVQLFQMMPGSGSVCVSTYHVESRSFRNWPPECDLAGRRKPDTVEVDFRGTTHLAVPVHYERNPFGRNSGNAAEDVPWGEIIGGTICGYIATQTGETTMLIPCIEFLRKHLNP